MFLHGGLSPAVAALGCEAINARVRADLGESSRRRARHPLESLAAAENGPLWYRGLAREDETAFAAALSSVLDAVKARAIVVGHTPVRTGKIAARFGGRVVMIDVGMFAGYGRSPRRARDHARGGHAGALPDRARFDRGRSRAQTPPGADAHN